MARFEEKVVIVTGAARGMGKAIAKAFAKEKASVVLVDLNAEAVQRIEKEVKDLGAEALGINCDVSSSGDVETAVSRAMAKFGKIDILVNNAGVLRTTRPLEEIPEDDWDLILNVNLKGVFLFSKEVLPLMRSKGFGKVINIASSAGRSVSELGGAHYTASKAGVLGLTRHSAKEYSQYGININSICPGLVETPMIREEAGEAKLNHWLSQIPLGRFADPEEIADLVMFLASPESKYITGATIDFNGGSLLI